MGTYGHEKSIGQVVEAVKDLMSKTTLIIIGAVIVLAALSSFTYLDAHGVDTGSFTAFILLLMTSLGTGVATLLKADKTKGAVDDVQTDVTNVKKATNGAMSQQFDDIKTIVLHTQSELDAHVDQSNAILGHYKVPTELIYRKGKD